MMTDSEFRHHYERLNGRTQHFVTVGEGRAVLFLHGFPDLWRTWRAQMRAVVEAGFMAIAPDLRGFGETEGDDDPQSSTTIDVMGDLVAILDHLEVDQVTVVAHDWGADTGWVAVQLRPERFAGIVTITVPWAPQGDASLPQLLKAHASPNYYLPWFLIPGPPEAEFDVDPARFLRRIFYTNSAERPGGVPKMETVGGSLLAGLDEPPREMKLLPDEELAIYAEAFAKSSASHAFNAYRSMHRSWQLKFGWADLTPTVAARTICGNKDVILGMPGLLQVFEQQAKLLPQGKPVIWLENCDHYAHLERPDEVSGHVLDFLHETRG